VLLSPVIKEPDYQIFVSSFRMSQCMVALILSRIFQKWTRLQLNCRLFTSKVIIVEIIEQEICEAGTREIIILRIALYIAPPSEDFPDRGMAKGDDRTCMIDNYEAQTGRKNRFRLNETDVLQAGITGRNSKSLAKFFD